MSALRKPNLLWAKEEYWAFENSSPARHEFFQGEVYAMAGASPRHNDIAGNIYATLHNQLRGKPCRVRASDQRIEVGESGLETYPDVSVICPPFRYNPQQTINSTDATVLVEVLSKRTRDYDQGQKFEFYKALPSLRHYLLVEQEHLGVEHRFLDESGVWQSEIFYNEADVVKLTGIACELKLADVYADIDFNSEA